MFRNRLPILASLLTLTLLGEVAAGPAAPALASRPASPAVTLYPSDAQGNRLANDYWAVSARPGTILHLYGTLGNPGLKKVPVRLLPADVSNSVYGGLAYSLSNQKLRATGKWIRLARTRYTVKPGKAFVLPFTVRLPRGLRPGQYVTGLVANPPAVGSHGAVGVHVVTRIAIAIVITVPGRLFSRFSLRRFNVQINGTDTLAVLHLANSGNTLLKGTGHLWIWRRGQKRVLLSIPISIGTTIPRKPVLYPVTLGRHPAATWYTYRLHLKWNGGQLSRHGRFAVKRHR